MMKRMLQMLTTAILSTSACCALINTTLSNNVTNSFDIKTKSSNLTITPLTLVLKNPNLGEITIKFSEKKVSEQAIKAAVTSKNDLNVSNINIYYISNTSAIVVGDGIVYQGWTYVSFTTNNFIDITKGIKGIIIDIIVDNNGIVYVATMNEAGISAVYKSSDNNVFTVIEGINDNLILFLATDNKGNVYAADSYGAVYKCLFGETNFTMQLSGLLGCYVVKKMACDNNGNIYLLTVDCVNGTNYKIFRSNNDTDSFEEFVFIKDKDILKNRIVGIYDLVINKYNQVYIVLKYKTVFNSLVSYVYKMPFYSSKFICSYDLIRKTDKYISILATDKEGNIYAASKKGRIYKINVDNDNVTFISKIHGRIDYLTTDSKGNVYAVTSSNNKKIFYQSDGTNAFTTMRMLDLKIRKLIISNDNIYLSKILGWPRADKLYQAKI